MKPKISLITFATRDLEKMIVFYRDGLGFPVHNYKPGDDMVMFRLEGTWLGLFPRDELAKDATVGGIVVHDQQAAAGQTGPKRSKGRPSRIGYGLGYHIKTEN